MFLWIKLDELWLMSDDVTSCVSSQVEAGWLTDGHVLFELCLILIAECCFVGLSVSYILWNIIIFFPLINWDFWLHTLTITVTQLFPFCHQEMLKATEVQHKMGKKMNIRFKVVHLFLFFKYLLLMCDFWMMFGAE